MINLDQQMLNRIESEYLNEIQSKVFQKITSLDQPIVNGFTNEIIIDNAPSTISEFLKALLASNKTQLLDRENIEYPEINNYFSTCEFIHYSDFVITEELVKKGLTRNHANMHDYRRKYFQKYQNAWLDQKVTQFPDYYKSNSEFKEFVNCVKRELDTLNNEIESVISYQMINPDFRHEILYKLGIEVCPYCNRNFISKYERNGKLKTTADLDHFYPKALFRLFSLSLWNFVPSCQICNSRFKLAKGIEIKNPFWEKINYEDLKFTYELNENSTTDLFFKKSSNFDIAIQCNNDEYRNNLELFELEKLYNSHKYLASEILFKKEKYNSTYNQLFNNLFEELELSEQERNEFLFGITMNEDDFYKKPLSKFIFDLVNE